MSKRVKLVVCNEPQNCETVKELAAIIKECEKLAQKWREEAKPFSTKVPRRIMLEECADELEAVLYPGGIITLDTGTFELDGFKAGKKIE